MDVVDIVNMLKMRREVIDAEIAAAVSEGEADDLVVYHAREGTLSDGLD